MSRVLLTSKQARGNHRHEFRPTGEARLRGGEHRLGAEVHRLLHAFPADIMEDAARGRISAVEVVERTVDRLDREPLERIFYDIWWAEARDTATRITVEINRELIRRGSPVRVRFDNRVGKAEQVTVGGVGEGVAGVAEGALALPLPLPTFDQAPAGSAGIAAARRQTGLLLADLTRQQADMIGTQIEAGFTTVQEFSTGRAVTGRTTGQTARAVFDILSESTPVSVTITAGDAAAYRASFTNGLFPGWATAVNRHADTVAADLVRRGVTGSRARDLLDKRTRTYGDRLRRSRSRMIARTETNIIQNIAQQDMMNQAQASGLVGRTAQKEWVTGPFDVCELCQGLGGRRVPVSGMFPGGVERPPRHPNCRCIIRMVPNLSGAPQRFGAGTPASPFQYRFADGFVAGVAPVA